MVSPVGHQALVELYAATKNSSKHVMISTFKKAPAEHCALPETGS